MIELLSDLGPHLLGTQEGLDHQLADLDAGLGDRYRWVGQSREGGRADEFSAIFYDTERLSLRGVEHHWLSDTPDVPGSRSWGNEQPRMITEAEFVDQLTGNPLRVLCTHLDHLSVEAQLRSAVFIRDRVRAGADGGIATVVLGDFNAPAETSDVYWTLLWTPLKDAFLAAEQRGPRLASFGDYQRPQADGPRIDWILLSPSIRVHRSEIVDRAPGGQYPSDHLPVLAEIAD